VTGPDNAEDAADARLDSAVARIDAGSPETCASELGPLFEGAPGFLARLCAERPFCDARTLFATARTIARTMPESDQLELIDAHPRLGAPPSAVSALSFVEQGYDLEVADRAAADAETDRQRVADALARLNAAYEAQFGFRYCVFVAGRSRAALLPGLEAALTDDRASEIDRALDAVVAIAEDRWAKRLGEVT
jgi:2-oxo-4-hydroxy-4-carboxy-5-ureidoimidazoline decarboxylase